MIAVSQLEAMDGVEYAEPRTSKEEGLVEAQVSSREPVKEWMKKWGYDGLSIVQVESDINGEIIRLV